MLCDDLEGWDKECGRDGPKGGHICVLIADSHCHKAEMNTTW